MSRANVAADRDALDNPEHDNESRQGWSNKKYDESQFFSRIPHRVGGL